MNPHSIRKAIFALSLSTLLWLIATSDDLAEAQSNEMQCKPTVCQAVGAAGSTMQCDNTACAAGKSGAPPSQSSAKTNTSFVLCWLARNRSNSTKSSSNSTKSSNDSVQTIIDECFNSKRKLDGYSPKTKKEFKDLTPSGRPSELAPAEGEGMAGSIWQIGEVDDPSVPANPCKEPSRALLVYSKEGFATKTNDYVRRWLFCVHQPESGPGGRSGAPGIGQGGADNGGNGGAGHVGDKIEVDAVKGGGGHPSGGSVGVCTECPTIKVDVTETTCPSVSPDYIRLGHKITIEIHPGEPAKQETLICDGDVGPQGYQGVAGDPPDIIPASSSIGSEPLSVNLPGDPSVARVRVNALSSPGAGPFGVAASIHPFRLARQYSQTKLRREGRFDEWKGPWYLNEQEQNPKTQLERSSRGPSTKLPSRPPAGASSPAPEPARPLVKKRDCCSDQLEQILTDSWDISFAAVPTQANGQAPAGGRYALAMTFDLVEVKSPFTRHSKPYNSTQEFAQCVQGIFWPETAADRRGAPDAAGTQRGIAEECHPSASSFLIGLGVATSANINDGSRSGVETKFWQALSYKFTPQTAMTFALGGSSQSQLPQPARRTDDYFFSGLRFDALLFSPLSVAIEGSYENGFSKAGALFSVPLPGGLSLALGGRYVERSFIDHQKGRGSLFVDLGWAFVSPEREPVDWLANEKVMAKGLLTELKNCTNETRCKALMIVARRYYSSAQLDNFCREHTTKHWCQPASRNNQPTGAGR